MLQWRNNWFVVISPLLVLKVFTIYYTVHIFFVKKKDFSTHSNDFRTDSYFAIYLSSAQWRFMSETTALWPLHAPDSLPDHVRRLKSEHLNGITFSITLND